jgi:hypothetical protein
MSSETAEIGVENYQVRVWMITAILISSSIAFSVAFYLYRFAPRKNRFTYFWKHKKEDMMENPQSHDYQKIPVKRYWLDREKQFQDSILAA